MHYFTWKLVFLKYFAHGCLWKQFFAFNVSHVPSNLICLRVFVALWLRSLTKFSSKIRATKLQKSAEICLTWIYFSDISLRSKSGCARFQIWSWTFFFRKIKQIPAKLWLFLTIGTVNKNIKCRRKSCRKPCSYF